MADPITPPTPPEVDSYVAACEETLVPTRTPGPPFGPIPSGQIIVSCADFRAAVGAVLRAYVTDYIASLPEIYGPPEEP